MSEGQGRHRMGAKSPQEPQRPQRARGLARPGPGHGAQGPSAIRLVWVYPDLLSTYGDRGNLLVLERRARLRGIGVEAVSVHSDQPVPRYRDRGDQLRPAGPRGR